MFFRLHNFGMAPKKDKELNLIESIKKDLIVMLQKKGVEIYKIDVDEKMGNLSLRLCIKE